MDSRALGLDDLVLCAAPVAHIPLLERLAPARAAGFAAVSVTMQDVWALEAAGMTAREVARRVDGAGLAVAEVEGVAAWLPSHNNMPADLPFHDTLTALTPERVVGAASTLGARSVAVVEMTRVRPTLDEAAKAFGHVCDLAADHGLPAHIEFLPFGGIPDLSAAWAVVQAAGRSNGGLTIDSWHLFRSGSTLSQLAAIPAERITTVQISDAPGEFPGDIFAETLNGRLLPGDGAFDLAELLTTLRRIGARAPIGVEVFSEETRTRSIAQTAHAWARAARTVMAQAKEDP